jgi:hypothetical protein
VCIPEDAKKRSNAGMNIQPGYKGSISVRDILKQIILTLALLVQNVVTSIGPLDRSNLSYNLEMRKISLRAEGHLTLKMTGLI